VAELGKTSTPQQSFIIYKPNSVFSGSTATEEDFLDAK
jgi:hypothetical protein